MDNQSGRKKSSCVPAALVTALAATIISGCASPSHPVEVRRCVDEKGKVLPDTACGGTGRSYVGGYYYPRFVYGGTGPGTPGTPLTGFRHQPTPGAEVRTSAGRTIVRGGFGSGSRGTSFGG